MPKEKMTLERHGEFTIKTTGKNHCGTLPILRIQYKLVCECTTKLDSRGFLFDQTEVDKFFQNKVSTSLSCEKLVADSLKKVLDLIEKENPHCEVRKASLTLSPQPFMASITRSVSFSKAERKAKAAERARAANDGEGVDEEAEEMAPPRRTDRMKREAHMMRNTRRRGQ